MYDLGRSHDLLVAEALAPAVSAVLPNWRIFTLGAPVPEVAVPVAAIIPPDGSADALDIAGFSGLPVIRMADAASLSHDLADLLADRLEEARRDAAEARRAAALLRREAEEQMRRLRMLENFTHTLGGPRHAEALQWPPTSLFLELTQPVTQRFPLDTRALAAIDLWLPDAEPDEAAGTVIELLDAAGNAFVRLSAEAPAGQGGGAWVRFSAPEPVSGAARAAIARVIPPPERAIAVGLTSPVPDPRFAVGLDGSIAAEGALAARIWRADYLAVLPPTNAGVAGTGAGGASMARAHRISLRDLQTPEVLFVPPLAQDYVASEYWARENAVLLHPSAEGPVCAILRDVDVAQVTAVSALVNVAHADSPVLGFAVGVCARGMATADNWQDHVGPYVFLPPGGWGECHSVPQVRPRSHCDVLLSTMIAGRGPNDNSWALFHKLRLTSEVT